MQHTQMGFHAFKMADKIARKEDHRQVFVEYVNEIYYDGVGDWDLAWGVAFCMVWGSPSFGTM